MEMQDFNFINFTRFSPDIGSLNKLNDADARAGLLSDAAARLDARWPVPTADRVKEKLWSGSQPDDTAGMSSKRLLQSLQAESSNQVTRSINAGISLAQVVGSGLQTISGDLERMGELAHQSASGSVGDNKRGTLQEEFSSLQDEIEQVVKNTSFEGVDAFASRTLQFRTGTEEGDSLEVITNDLTDPTTETGAVLDRTVTTIASQADAQNAIANVGAAREQIGSLRADNEAVMNRFESAARLSSIRDSEAAAGLRRLNDADNAKELAMQTREQILNSSRLSMAAQANASPADVLAFLRF